MRMDKLTSRFQQALADAQSIALGRDHQLLEPAHVMLALLDSQGGSVRPLLLKAGADVNKLRAELGALLDRSPKVEGTPGDVHVSNDLNRVLNLTDKLAQQRGDQFISSELFVLAASAFEMRFTHFLAAVFAGRCVRFLVLALLTIKFGPEVIHLVGSLARQHLSWLVGGVSALIVLGVAFWQRKRWMKKPGDLELPARQK